MGSKNKPWTYNDQRKILELANEGWSIKHIAESVGRTGAAVQTRLGLLRSGDVRRPIKEGESLEEYLDKFSRLPAAELAVWAGVTVKQVLLIGIERGIKYGNYNLPASRSFDLSTSERKLLLDTLTELAKHRGGSASCACECCDLKARLNEIWDKGEHGRALFDLMRPYMIGGDKYDG